MSNNTSANATASVSFPIFAFLTGVLLILKLGGVGSFATLSWWWVFAPMLFGLGLTIFFVLIALIVIFAANK